MVKTSLVFCKLENFVLFAFIYLFFKRGNSKEIIIKKHSGLLSLLVHVSFFYAVQSTLKFSPLLLKSSDKKKKKRKKQKNIILIVVKYLICLLHNTKIKFNFAVACYCTFPYPPSLQSLAHSYFYGTLHIDHTMRSLST